MQRLGRPCKSSMGSIIRGAGSIVKKKGDSLLGPDILGERDEKKTSVTGYGETCFQINGVIIQQSVLLLPNSYYLWNARTFQDITIESLLLFPIIHPTLEIVFVGCGEKFPSQLPAEVTSFYRAKGITLEASNTFHAATSFDVLNSEGRNVAAALLTLKDWKI